MEPETLKVVGAALFGERWPNQLAAALDVHPRSFRRWCAGTAPIPDRLAAELRELVQVRISELNRVLDETLILS